MVLILHFATITQPSDYSFDESYYVPAAKDILAGVSLGRLEHPPLGQAIISVGIAFWGDNPIGWRFFAVIFGSFSLIFLYLICRQLKLSKYVSTLAAFLLAVDNLTFVMSGVAMLDVYSVTFIFLAFLLFLKGRFALSGISVGLAALAKLTGILSLVSIGLYWLITDRKIKQAIVLGLSALISFFVFLPLIDFVIVHHFVNPISRLSDTFSQSITITFTEYFKAHSELLQTGMTPAWPWQWLYQINSTAYFFFNPAQHKFINLYYLALNPAIWILIVPAMIFLIYLVFKRNKPAIFFLCWFAGTYFTWVPISLITDRLTYVYYFYPSVAVVCASVAMLLEHVKSRYVTPLYLGTTLIFFVSIYLGNVLLLILWAGLFFVSIYYYLDSQRI
jgi:dolichyl-phosphate-mannose-protein mannosyltransferase